jgi:hypothetical protein
MKNSESNKRNLHVLNARYLNNFKIEVEFSDGKLDKIDFREFIIHHPNSMIRKYQDESLFKQFHLTLGNIEWGDLDMIFSVEFLYNFNNSELV